MTNLYWASHVQQRRAALKHYKRINQTLSPFFLSGKKEISNETSINAEKVSERHLATTLQSSTPRNQTLARSWPCHIHFSRAHAKLHPIAPLTHQPDPLTIAAPWAQQLIALPGGAGFAVHTHNPAVALWGRWVAQPLGEWAPGISPRPEEFPWRTVRGLFAICSASLPENIDWTFHTFRFSHRCFIFLLRDFFLLSNNQGFYAYA